MKKIFAFVAAVAASMSLSAQYAHVDMTGLNSETATSLEVNHVLGAIANVGTLQVPFDDTWKVVNVKTDSYGLFRANGNDLNTDTLGIQGQTNGKDAGGGTPTTTLEPFASGAALKYVAEADGYLTVFHKASSNKQYVVFEEGDPIIYEYAQLAKTDAGMEVVNFTLQPADADGYFTGEKIDFVEVIAGKSTDNTWKKNGESAIRFKVYAGSEYLFGATGSKMSILGVYFSTAKEEISVAKMDGSESLVLLAGGTTDLKNKAAAVKATKAIKNGQLVLTVGEKKFNVLGAEL